MDKNIVREKSQRGLYKVYLWVKIFVLLVIVLCIITCAVAFVYGQIYNIRYIQIVKSDENNNVAIRLFDTWKKEIIYYAHYKNNEDEWLKTWQVIEMDEIN